MCISSPRKHLKINVHDNLFMENEIIAKILQLMSCGSACLCSFTDMVFYVEDE